ncbi:hypothetical protein CJF30_00001464 [Rutstroemia sp. NJR-2017a BBW]|nr:hypothetical protein CJF30_00001464 [Rutstroemia sp. NJR-2017a BBW]
MKSINLFKFPLWVTTPYSVEINKLSKELKIENYKNLTILLAPNQYLRTSRNSRRNQTTYEASREIVEKGAKVLNNEKADLLAKSGTKMDLLKIRYSYLKSYLYLLEYTSTNKCICGAKEIPEYLLLNYSHFNLARSKLKDKLVINYLLFLILFDTTPGIEASIAYLSEIRICTRKYHLARELVDD